MTNEIDEEVAERFGLEYVEALYDFPLVKDAFPYEFSKRFHLVALEQKEDHLLVAIADPLNFEALKEARLLVESEIKEVVAPQGEIDEAIERCYSASGSEATELLTSLREKGKEKEADDVLIPQEHVFVFQPRAIYKLIVLVCFQGHLDKSL